MMASADENTVTEAPLDSPPSPNVDTTPSVNQKFQTAMQELGLVFQPPLKPSMLPVLYHCWLVCVDATAYIDMDNFISRLGVPEFRTIMLPLFEQAIAGDIENLQFHNQILREGMIPLRTSNSNSGKNVTKGKAKHWDAYTEAQKIAVFKSWESEYQGAGVLKGFEMHIRKHWTNGSLYARYITLVQSSMVGKSRMMNEFSKKFLCIPVNLRPEYATGALRFCPPSRHDILAQGYPAGDHSVLDFVLRGKRNEQAFLPSCFLAGVFKRTRLWLEENHATGFHPLDFQKFMTNGQQIHEQGPDRIAFYDDVLTIAEEVKKASIANLDGEVYASTVAFDELLHLMSKLHSDFQAHWTAWKHGDRSKAIRLPEMPLIYLVIDEAQSLSLPTNVNPSETTDLRFKYLRRALQRLNLLPLVTVFLSTTTIGSVGHQPIAREMHSSDSIFQQTPTIMPPWTTFGWDHLAHDRKIRETESITDLASIQQISKFGRPSWGLYHRFGDYEVKANLSDYIIEKLVQHTSWRTCQINDAMYAACWSQRMVIELDTSIRQQRQFVQNEVENHLRTYMALPEDQELMISSVPSEPILSEAASIFMTTNPNFSTLDSLRRIITNFGRQQDPSERGALIAMALLTKARDSIVTEHQLHHNIGAHLPSFSIPTYFEHLFHQNIASEMPSMCLISDENKSLADQFAHSTLFFNHFIQPDQEDVAVDRDMHPLFLGRCSAIRGAKHQPGFDLMHIATLFGTSIQKDNRVLILWQIKNSVQYNDVPDKDLFHAMCPVKLNMIKKDEKMPCIIRIVFALASHTPKFTKVEYTKEEVEERCYVTTYDFYVAGMDPSVFVPVLEGETEAWKYFLRDEPRWSAKYTHVAGSEAQNAQRSQAPLARKHEGHTRALDGLQIPYGSTPK